MSWNFLEREIVEEFHRRRLMMHGGGPVLRDANALESALDRPKNKAAQGDPDVFELAAASLFGIARNHPFVDGNKRMAIVTAGVFLEDNGQMLTADNAKVAAFVLAVAAGEIIEDGAAAFFRDHCEAV
jgi:death on curing protein